MQNNNLNNIYPYKPIILPYKYTASEPYIHRDVVRIHYEKFYLTYVENLNKLLSEKKALQFLTLKEIITKSFKLPSDYVVNLKRSATAMYCHEVYFGFKSAKEVIADNKYIIEKFKTSANNLHGSGFVWVVQDKSEKLSVVTTRNTETPNLNLLTPILCIDLWEHSYFLQYKYKRVDYINYFCKMAL
ncbi:MAG: hypothetical protein LBL93_06115 [Ruminococcus sp.]|jgi:Fe-Mn family superoxide dismutase|nr:hypothetical protein [Ruminococcus sp.]